jgi:hypothetical protein
MLQVSASYPFQLRTNSPLVLGNHWRTSVLQAKQKLVDAIENACLASPKMSSVSKDILLKIAAHCDSWTETLSTRVDAQELAGYPKPPEYAPTAAQKNAQAYDLMRLSLLDLLVWHLLPNAFAQTSPPDLEFLTQYEKAADKWQERLYGVVQTLVTVAQEKWPELNNDPTLASSDLPGVLYDRVEGLLSAATGSKALANLHSLALGIILYTVRTPVGHLSRFRH